MPLAPHRIERTPAVMAQDRRLDIPDRMKVAAVSGRHLEDSVRDAMFVEMLRAFRRTGGIAREAEILDRCRRSRLPIAHPRSIEAMPICFEWGGRRWLPWFQFDASDMSLRTAPRRVIEELSPVFDGWSLAVWLAAPNTWLDDTRPVDRLDEHLADVLQAARADRFITAG